MTKRARIGLVLAGGVLLAVAVGASGAIAVSRALEGDESRAVIEDAAQELGVEPRALSDALKQALGNWIDEAVEEGRLTEEQGERLKERLERGGVPFFGGPFFRGSGDEWFGSRGLGLGLGFGFRLLGQGLETAATYLGVEEAELRERLREGESLADIARDEGKSVDGLVDALVEGVEEQVDDAVEEGRLDEERASRLLERLEERVAELVNGELRFPGRGRGFGPWWGFRPGPPPHAGPRG